VLALAACPALVSACGEERSESSTTPRSTETTLPRMTGLPALPMPFDAATGTFQRLWESVDEALEMEIPVPQTRSEAAYRRWVEGTLADWLDERASVIDASLVRQRALEESNSTEQIVAHALVAWLCERTAEDVLGSQVPEVSPERAELLRQAWRDRMEPVAETAREHWARCVELGAGGAIETQAWVEVCRDHERGVQPALRSEGAQERP
jgi:hypothetical protein